MDVTRFLKKVEADDIYRDQIVHRHTIPVREAAFEGLGKPLPDALMRVLAASGIEHLYTHQVEAIEDLRSDALQLLRDLD